MAGKKSAAILLIVALVFGLELTKINVPDDFERPYFYKAKIGLIKASHLLAQAGSALNFGTELSNFRNILSVVGTAFKYDIPENSGVNIAYKVVANVPVRVYSPKSSTSGSKPTMIYYHGGGFIAGDLTSYELFLFEFVRKLNMVIISVDYRMSPEYPFPTPTSDCYAVTKYILQNPKEFHTDLHRVVLAGDSAGGNAVAVITQRLLQEKLPQPKLQLLIYPWTQMFNNRLPSVQHNLRSGLLSTSVSIQKMSLYYMGLQHVSNEMESILISNNNTALLTDKELKAKIKSYLDVEQIPQKYKTGRKYYNNRKDSMMYVEKLDEDNILRKNKNLANAMKKLYDPNVSPLFADSERLVGLPKAHFVIFEWDTLKDEGLLYAERLRKAGVQVDIAFYENAFHGIVTFVHERLGYKVARDLQRDLVKYLKSNL